MKKLLIPITLILLTFLSTACSGKNDQSFMIYISDNDKPIDINSATKILDIEDIIVYDWESQEILITEDAVEKINELNPPVNGQHFAVFLGDQAVYDGYIWPLYSSLSYDGIIIEFPLFSDNILKIKKGYPGDDFFSGEDLRNNQKIYDSLLQDGKIQS